MNKAKVSAIMVLILGLMVCQVNVSEAAPMGTAFTYQGNLMDANQPADGEYDFEFKLFNDPCTGAQQGSTIEAGDLNVIEGYFTLGLDFGSDVFNGDARWLRIRVRPGDSNDVNDFATLIPRQEITPVPYALHTRGIFVDDAGNVSIGINSPDPEDKLYVVVTGPDNMGVLAEATHTTGDTTGIEAVVYSTNGVAGSFVNESGGRVLVCHSGTDPRVHAFSVEGDGDIWVEGNVFTRGTGGSIFEGDLSVHGNHIVLGTLTKGGGSFKIDHPLDPENKYLQHSFIESPDMMNVYNGNVLLDEKGKAVVELPEYFKALNRDFRYQLTAIGTPAPNLYIAEEISDNHFKIAGGKKGTKVSWQVTGIRQDAYAKANRIVVEENKSAEERGYYLHPTAYGLPEEKGIEAVHNARFPETRQVAKKVD